MMMRGSTLDIAPNQTLYVKNINDKVSEFGERTLFVGLCACAGGDGRQGAPARVRAYPGYAPIVSECACMPEMRNLIRSTLR